MESKKIVTKRGLVAPSPENPKRVEEFIPAGAVAARTTARFGSVTPRPTDAGEYKGSEDHLDETRELATDPQAAERPLSPAETAAREGYRKWAPEDLTPSEGSNLDEELERSRFRTEPGGGKNRVSGGRLQAKAYVSPVTVKPSTGNTPITAAIKVHDIVENAVRAYQTEPSLLRRRQSSLPPKPGSGRERLRVLMGGAAAIVLLGAVIFWITLRGAERVTPSAQDTPVPALTTERSPPVGSKTTGQNQAEKADIADDTDKQASEVAAPMAVPQAPPPQAPAPAPTPIKKKVPAASSSAAPSPSAAPSTQSQKPKDLWLE